MGYILGYMGVDLLQYIPVVVTIMVWFIVQDVAITQTIAGCSRYPSGFT